MARYHYDATIDVRVPRGIEGFWKLMCELQQANGRFTIADIDAETSSRAVLIYKYVTALVAAGIVARLDTEHQQRRFQQHVYSIVKPQATTPRVRQDGSVVPPTAQECVWNAIRTLKQFTVPELLFAATTDQVKPTRKPIAAYVAALEGAGYLTRLGEETPLRYRLKPSMNTGPKPPACRMIHSRVVWDSNLNRFFGRAPEARELAR